MSSVDDLKVSFQTLIAAVSITFSVSSVIFESVVFPVPML